MLLCLLPLDTPAFALPVSSASVFGGWWHYGRVSEASDTT